MTREKQIKFINERRRILKDVAELDRTIAEIGKSGTSQATLSTGAGSKSYSRIDLASLRELRSELIQRAQRIANTLAGRPAIKIGIAHIRRS